MFKLENIIKLSISIGRTKKAIKSLKINTNNLEIKAKKKDCMTTDIKSIIFFFQVFYVYTQILVFLADLENKL